MPNPEFPHPNEETPREKNELEPKEKKDHEKHKPRLMEKVYKENNPEIIQNQSTTEEGNQRSRWYEFEDESVASPLAETLWEDAEKIMGHNIDINQFNEKNPYEASIRRQNIIPGKEGASYVMGAKVSVYSESQERKKIIYLKVIYQTIPRRRGRKVKSLDLPLTIKMTKDLDNPKKIRVSASLDVGTDALSKIHNNLLGRLAAQIDSERKKDG